MNQQDDIRQLITYIEENLRSSPSSGLHFVDTRNFLGRLGSRQNHVVYGRRGVGKTRLVTSIPKNENHIDIYINLEDYKDITFPNIVIKVLVNMFEKLNDDINNKFRWYKFNLKSLVVKKRLKITIAILRNYLLEPDEETQEVNTKESTSSGLSAGANLQGIQSSIKSDHNASKEVKRTLLKNKLDYLRIQLTEYKKLIAEISSLLENKSIFIILDDYYFIDKSIQPDLIDYLHRLTKGTPLFIKIATIKYRSKLYKKASGSYIGVEPGHDVLEVDMDYTLDDFNELQNFMNELLSTAIEFSKAKVNINDMFSGDGFSQLCLASGGVPRDFLSLFVSLGNKVLLNSRTIGKIDVTEAAIAGINSKKESLKTDSGNSGNILSDCLDKIKYYVFNVKRTNVFLIAREQNDEDAQLKQIIRELVDLRLIHLVDENTSKAPSDGKRYEAYIIDIGLYDNARPMNFTQVEPGQRDKKSRRDALRSAPVITMRRLKKEEKKTSNVKTHRNVPDSLELEYYQTEMSFE